jgi:hypothetical protein
MDFYYEALQFFDEAISINPNFDAPWNNKGPAVRSFAAGKKASWIFNKSDGKYLDGNFQLTVMFRRPKDLEEVIFSIEHAYVIYDGTFKDVLVETQQGIDIGIK